MAMKKRIKSRSKIVGGNINKLLARRWGALTTRDIGAARQFKISMLHESLPPGSSAPEVVHKRTKELIYVAEGSMIAFLNGRKFLFKKNDYFVVPAGMSHKFEATSEGVEALSIFMPPFGGRKPDAKIVL